MGKVSVGLHARQPVMLIN